MCYSLIECLEIIYNRGFCKEVQLGHSHIWMNFKSKIKDKQGDIYGKESTIEVFVKK